MTEEILSRPLVRTFMTHGMGDVEITALSTGRDDELRRIMQAIVKSWKATPGRLQHVVLYGSRGFGKSFMTRRVQIEVAKTCDADKVLYLLFPEEQHNLQRSPHAFLEMITVHLSHREMEDDSGYEEAHFRWPRPGEQARRWNEAAAGLEDALDAALPEGKGLVILVVENFDILLATLFKDEEDEQRLRKWLDRTKNRIMLFATATGTVDINYERPLFKAFASVRLAPWSVDDCITYFNKQRDLDQRPALDADQTAKARAIAEFIGGTPRLAHLLAEVLETRDALSVAETMSALADKLAEYYRRRIEDLPPLARGLLDALIRSGEPASQTALAGRVGAEGQNAIARVMSNLQRADIVRGRPAPDGREKLYSVVDRVFVHYYRLRQGSRAAQATPLSTILDFLKSFYSRDEQRAQGLLNLEEGRLAEARLFNRLALEGEQDFETTFTSEFSRRLEMYLDAAPDCLPQAVAMVGAMMPDKAEDAYEFCRRTGSATPAAAAILSVIKAQALHCMGQKHLVQGELDVALGATDDNVIAKVIASLEAIIYFRDAAEEKQMAQRIARDFIDLPLVGLPSRLAAASQIMNSWFLGQLGKHEDALDKSESAAGLARQVGDNVEEAKALRQMAWSLGRLGRHEEAVEKFEIVVELAREAGTIAAEAWALGHVGWTLSRLGRHKDATEKLERAAALTREFGYKPGEARALRGMGWSLGQLGQHEKANEILERAAELAREAGEKVAEAWALQYMGWSLGQLGRHEEANEKFECAAELAREAGEKAQEATALRCMGWSLGQLGLHQEATEKLERSAELSREAGDNTEETVALRRMRWSLGRLNRHEEAIEKIERVAMLAREAGDLAGEANALGDMGWSLSQLGRHEEAIEKSELAAERAREAGDRVSEAWVLRLIAISLLDVGRYEEAWTKVGDAIVIGREIGSFFELSRGFSIAVEIASHIPQPGVIGLFNEWLDLDSGKEKLTKLASPEAGLGDLFIAATICENLPELVAFIERRQERWSSLNGLVFFLAGHGGSLAQFSSRVGQAEAYTAFSKLLPIIAGFMGRIPSKYRDSKWLPDLIAGFAESCRDPSLLRDLSGLMTEDLASQAPETAKLLLALADVDDADNPRAVLARLDPDVATLIRRLRDFPDSERKSAIRKKGKGRKQ